MFLVGLLSMGNGGELQSFATGDRMLLHGLALGALLAFLVVYYLWWKVWGAVFRLVLLALAGFVAFIVMRQIGII